jgi:YVTN family beta-propeller protein
MWGIDMKKKEKLYSIALASTALILVLILTSSMASAATVQGASSTMSCAYVANMNRNTVSVIDTATNTVTSTVNVGNQPEGVAVTPDGTKVYVANMHSNTVSVIDTATNTVTTTVNVGNTPRGVAVTPDGKKLYVVNFGSNNVSVIDTATNKVTSSVNVGSINTAFGKFIGSIPAHPALPVFHGYTNPPTDPNHDGLYEDINGNGVLDFDDIVTYYDNIDLMKQNGLTAFFDYNHNGLIDFDDVKKLNDML